MRKIIVTVAGGLLLLTAGCASSTHHTSAGASAAANQSILSTHSTTPTSAAPVLQTSAPAPSSSVPTTVAQTQAPATTQKLVIRPVTAHGQPTAGYTVTPMPNDAVATCITASPAAIDNNIVYCSPSALSAQACWSGPSAGHVLCLSQADKKNLLEYAVDTPLAPTAHLATPSPIKLALSDGTVCGLRDGGAWDGLAGHPGLVASYGCAADSAVWTVPNQDGVNRSASSWTVQVARFNDQGGLRTFKVVSATFVGTAS